MRKDEFGIIFLKSEIHILKKIDGKIDLEKIAYEFLSIQAIRVTMLNRSLE